MITSLYDGARIGQIFPPSGKTTAQTGAAIDCAGYDSIVFILGFGLLTDTGALAFAVEESANGSTGWTAVSGATYAATEVTTDDNAVRFGHVRLNARLRYLRLVSTVSNTDSMVYEALYILHGMDRQVDQTQTSSYSFNV